MYRQWGRWSYVRMHKLCQFDIQKLFSYDMLHVLEMWWNYVIYMHIRLPERSLYKFVSIFQALDICQFVKTQHHGAHKTG